MSLTSHHTNRTRGSLAVAALVMLLCTAGNGAAQSRAGEPERVESSERSTASAVSAVPPTPLQLRWLTRSQDVDRATRAPLGAVVVAQWGDGKPAANVYLQVELRVDSVPNSAVDDEIGNAVVRTDSSGRVSLETVRIMGRPRKTFLYVRALDVEGRSEPIALMVGPLSVPHKINILQPPPTEFASGAALGSAPQVRLVDAAGRPVAQEPVSITVGPAAGDVRVAGHRARTNDNGVAEFRDFRMIGRCNATGCGKYQIRFVSNADQSDDLDVQLLRPPVSALVMLDSADREARVGALVRRLRLQARSDGNLPVPGLTIVATDLSGATLQVDTTDDDGIALFDQVRMVAREGTDAITFTSGNLQLVHPVSLKSGAPARLDVLTQPSARFAYDSVLPTAPVLLVTDAGGNPLSGIPVRAVLCARPLADGLKGGEDLKWECRELQRFLASLHGDTQVLSGTDGRATFGNLRIRGRTADYRLIFEVPGREEKVYVWANPASHHPLRDFDNNYVGISVIKTISGVAPDNEFFDMRFRLRLPFRTRLLANTDIALSRRDSKDSVASSQKRLTEAALMLNAPAVWVKTPYSDIPQRQVALGAQMKIFATIPYWGVHLAGTELGGSPFQGSSLSISYLTRWYRDTIAVIDGDSVALARNNIGIDFFVRSSVVEFFKVLTIRGAVLIPAGNRARPATRIAVAVPLGDVFQF